MDIKTVPPTLLIVMRPLELGAMTSAEAFNPRSLRGPDAAIAAKLSILVHSCCSQKAVLVVLPFSLPSSDPHL
jgi:hypothetical protein